MHIFESVLINLSMCAVIFGKFLISLNKVTRNNQKQKLCVTDFSEQNIAQKTLYGYSSAAIGDTREFHITRIVMSTLQCQTIK